MDDGTDEVVVLLGDTNGELLDLGNQLLLELGPHGLGDVEPGSSAALLSLVLEGASHGLLDRIVEISGGVDKMEVLATSLADNSRVRAVSTLSNALTNGTIQLSEDSSAAGVVKSSKLLVLKNDLGHLNGVSGHELDHILGQASLEEDVVDQPVGGNGEVTGLPDNDVTQQRRRSRQVTSDGSEVERADGIDETLKRSVLEPIPDHGRIVDGLGVVELLSVVDVESEEISQLSSRVDLSLPSVLALAQHGGGHDIVTVFARDEVGSLEEDGRTVGEGESLPRRLGRESRINGLGNIGGGGSVVGGDGGSVVGRVDLLGEGRGLDLTDC